ncbi:Guanosine-3',5'-bis(diphosphate) 3'-pyrophosphohydrolase MESH1 [Polyplax serrata]|uniref:Guanosine-3',5'-bis(diphosphate) 3'-pyrophosphohydrolase MESH1 n=1 Tax=Polyplax serrata TaxID=468196 RepID=A0ABR1AE11_POLSC
MALTPPNLMSDLIKCVNFAAVKHTNQRRKNVAQTPYINHPIGVAYILTNEGQINDLDVIQAAILHDTVEDTDTTFEEIASNFGEKVAGIVKECTDDKNLAKNERKQLQILNAKNSSVEAKLVKLADKLYNLRDLDKEIPVGWSVRRVKEYFEWAFQVVEGLKGTNEEIEKKLYELFKKHNVQAKSQL